MATVGDNYVDPHNDRIEGDHAEDAEQPGIHEGNPAPPQTGYSFMGPVDNTSPEAAAARLAGKQDWRPSYAAAYGQLPAWAGDKGTDTAPYPAPQQMPQNGPALRPGMPTAPGVPGFQRAPQGQGQRPPMPPVGAGMPPPSFSGPENPWIKNEVGQLEQAINIARADPSLHDWQRVQFEADVNKKIARIDPQGRYLQKNLPLAPQPIDNALTQYSKQIGPNLWSAFDPKTGKVTFHNAPKAQDEIDARPAQQRFDEDTVTDGEGNKYHLDKKTNKLTPLGKHAGAADKGESKAYGESTKRVSEARGVDATGPVKLEDAYADHLNRQIFDASSAAGLTKIPGSSEEKASAFQKRVRELAHQAAGRKDHKSMAALGVIGDLGEKDGRTLEEQNKLASAYDAIKDYYRPPGAQMQSAGPAPVPQQVRPAPTPPPVQAPQNRIRPRLPEPGLSMY
jgi:hypothetical protein